MGRRYKRGVHRRSPHGHRLKLCLWWGRCLSKSMTLWDYPLPLHPPSMSVPVDLYQLDEEIKNFFCIPNTKKQTRRQRKYLLVLVSDI